MSRPRLRLSGWRRRVVLALAAVAVYALVGFFVVPWIARVRIPKLTREILHRESTVARVRFNPFTFTGVVEGFDLRDRDGAELVGVGRLKANFQLSGIFLRAWRFREIAIDRPKLAAHILADGRPSVADLFEPDPSKPPKEGGSLRRVRIDRFTMTGGRLDFLDESRTPAFTQALTPLEIDVRDLTTIPNESGGHAVTLGIGDKTRLKWSGRQSVQPLHLEGQLAVTEIALERPWIYAVRDAPLALRRGAADISCSYDVSQAGAGGVALTISDGSIAVRDLAIGPKDGSDDWLAVSSIAVDGIRVTWPESALQVASVKVTEPSARAWIEPDGRFGWMDALERMKPAPREAATTARPWTITVAAAEIERGVARVEDRSVTPPAELRASNVGVRLASLSSDLTKPVTGEVSATVGDNGKARCSGSVTLDPLRADLDVAAEGVDLMPYAVYVPFANAKPLAAAATGKGKLRIDPGSPRFRFQGEGSLDGVDLADNTGARVVSWERARAQAIDVTVAPNRTRIGDIDVDRAFLKVVIDTEGKLNLTRLRVDREATPTRAELPAVDIRRIALRNAKIDYTDESLILPFGTDIHDANGSIKDFSTRSHAPARLALEGRVADTGYVKADGTLRVADPFAASEVTVTFRDVSMPKLTPYVAQFAGYAVKDGSLDLDIHYRIQNRRLVGDHRVVAKNLVLGEKVEGSKAPPLPVRLAIALLKDKDGRIDLAVPIEGTVDSPEFNYRKIFWQAVRKILGNVAAAPFRAIGRLFGRDDEDIDLVGFASGRSDLLPPEAETLAKLAEELAKRPELTVEVEGRFDPVADVAAIRRARLEQRIDGKRASVDSLEGILEALYVESFSAEKLEATRARFQPSAAPAAEPAPKKKSRKTKRPAAPPPPPPTGFDAAGFYDSLRTQLLDADQVGEDELKTLASTRSAAIVAALTQAPGLDASRVRAKDPGPVKRKKQGSDLVPSEMTLTAGD